MEYKILLSSGKGGRNGTRDLVRPDQLRASQHTNHPASGHPEQECIFRLLHKEDDTPVKYIKTCPADGKALDNDEIVKGYEFEKGHFVIMEENDFEAVDVKKGRSIEVLHFVRLAEVDPIYFHKTYYLAPDERSGKAFRLFREAMEKQKKAALCRFSLRNKQQLALVKPYDSVLSLETLFYYDEVLSTDGLAPSEKQEETKAGGEELELAEGLIDKMTSDFDLSRYHDEYRDELLSIINRKIEGKEVTIPEVEPLAPVVDIMDALKESIARQEEEGKRERAS